jgi:hypothetical protein
MVNEYSLTGKSGWHNRYNYIFLKINKKRKTNKGDAIFLYALKWNVKENPYTLQNDNKEKNKEDVSKINEDSENRLNAYLSPSGTPIKRGCINFDTAF